MFYRVCKTYLIYCLYSSKVLKNIKILSKYVNTQIFNYNLKILLTNCYIIVSVLVKSNNITKDLYNLYLIQITVFYLFFFLIFIKLKTNYKLSFVKIVVLYNLSRILSANNKKYRFLIILILKLL